ncbi:flavin reductase family protein [Streptomyces sp. NPDC091281]|uniref:flavin reductase family protein n=1 Tax=Streptomyces sp. NPDC091281 TaxID=3365985 RepID=UPI00381C3DFE
MTATQSGPRISTEDFRFAFRSHPAGVAIVTADAGDGPVAMTVSSVASVSIDPPTLMFSASAGSSSTPTIRSAETLVVHLLAADHVELAKLGARRGAERFGDDVHWGRLPTGEPFYPDANWLRGRVIRRLDVEGATIIVVEAVEARPRDDGMSVDPTPLAYHNRHWHVLTDRSMLPPAVAPFYAVYGRE